MILGKNITCNKCGHNIEMYFNGKVFEGMCSHCFLTVTQEPNNQDVAIQKELNLWEDTDSQ